MSNNSSRIALNTILLYLRSIIMLILAIYTSRVLLSTLGVEDYGTYNVVGGVVAMFASIKSVLASAVQRYLNYYKGKADLSKVHTIFNVSILIHILIAICFGIVIEIFGLWFISNKLVLPAGVLPSAVFTFHCSVLATIITIITIPYDSVIISNERMDFYAYISIADTLLKLLVIFCIPLLPYDNIESYALLILCETILVRVITIFYCRGFKECKLQLIYDQHLIKEISSFASWNFLGCTAFSLVEEGSNFILNLFGGVTANAARGIAYQVRSAITLLSNNVVVASQPYIMQQAAAVDKDRFFSYVFLQSRLVFYIVSITILPIYVYSEQILTLWLTEVPPHANVFIKSISIYMVIMSLQKSLDISFKSYGKISKYQLVDTAILILTLPVGYFTLKLGAPLHYIFYTFSLIRIIDYFFIVLLAKKIIGLSPKHYFTQVAVPCIKASIIFIGIAFFFIYTTSVKSTLMLFLLVLAVVFSSILACYFFIFNKNEKELCLSFVKRILKK